MISRVSLSNTVISPSNPRNELCRAVCVEQPSQGMPVVVFYCLLFGANMSDFLFIIMILTVTEAKSCVQEDDIVAM